MNPLILQEPVNKDFLYPFTVMHSIIDLRIGILTLREKWEYLLGEKIQIGGGAEESGIPATVLPSTKLADDIKQGKFDFANAPKLSFPWQIFQLTDEVIRMDYELVTQNRVSNPISKTNQLISPKSIFVEEGVKMEHVILNASTGPIYISKNAEVMEGSMIRGPFFLGEESVVKMGSKIYGACSIGKKCIVGGEIKNSVFFDYSNKAHDGYIGDSVIGSWCNLGAGTSNSNLKNTGGVIKIWSRESNSFIPSTTKCGLLMGDYSRSAINTSFNTGTVVGICCNVFGSGLTPKYIPDFSWGFPEFETYDFEKAIQDISQWKKFKNELMTDNEIQTLKPIFANLKKNK
jgi:UDP-N-acetylglucosamine diphosphorylase / glucose-1-phosphate thymidylyltransferase / UDP-N-acetylgalactosamine diphosphorylase / glucosamine-1-phosphate N-acetyltransferase / galactosamine-1-phosphate N-acetyltransferase